MATWLTTSLLYLFLLIPPPEAHTLNGAQYVGEADNMAIIVDMKVIDIEKDGDEEVIVAALFQLDAARVVILPHRTAKVELDAGGRAEVKLCLANVPTILRQSKHTTSLI